MNGTLLVIEADDIQAVMQFIGSDPYVKEGLFSRGGAAVGLEPRQSRAECESWTRQLCRFSDVPDGGARVVDEACIRRPVIVVRRGEQVWAYVNRCPHFSVPLDFVPGSVSCYRSQVLMCAHHSALFRFDDGVYRRAVLGFGAGGCGGGGGCCRVGRLSRRLIPVI